MNFQERLKELRLYCGLLQKELAEKLGVETRQISRLETGYNEPNLSQLIKIADFFEVSVDYLLGRESEDGRIFTSRNPDAADSDERRLFAAFRKMNDEQKKYYLAYGLGMIMSE